MRNRRLGPVHLWIVLVLWVLMAAAAPTGRAQAGPEKGGREIQVWSGGGHAYKGVANDTGLWSLGVRYGWVLTNPRGPGFLRGRLESVVEAVPVFLAFQPNGTTYAVGLNPLVTKWMFDTRRRVVPYFELGSGGLISHNQIPPGTSRVNFTSSGAFGLHVVGDRFTWSAEVRYMHISNAGISSNNPGVNTLQLRIGLGMFTPRGGRNRTNP